VDSVLIFVNYRSSDEPFAALLIDRRLTERFGAGQVFRDSRTIRLGTHFPAEIQKALAECQVMIVVIGERWLRAGPDGRRLIDDPDDWVRMEIAEALRRDVLVVPVLVGNASLPPASALPAGIAGLASRQHRSLRVRDADRDASSLIDELVDLLGSVGLSASRPARPRRPRTARPRALHSQPAPASSHVFYAPVDARYAIFGNVHSMGER
jgi:hypothetical protein